MGNWYVFFVQTGQEYTACNFLNKLFDMDKSVSFVPQLDITFKRAGLIRKELKPMFQGYVFVDSILDERIFITQAHRYIRFSNCIFRLLGDQVGYMKLHRNEKDYLLGFLNDKYIVEESKGFIVGDKVFIKSGPLKSRESIIKKIDRHKRLAEIELVLFGDVRRIRVPLQILSKT